MSKSKKQYPEIKTGKMSYCYQDVENGGTCTSHFHEPVKLSKAKLNLDNPKEMFEAIQDGTISMAEFENFVASQNESATKLDEISKLIVNPNGISISISATRELLNELDEDDLHKAVELLLNKKKLSPYENLMEIAFAANSNVSEEDRLKVLDRLSNLSSKLIIENATDANVISQVYDNTLSVRGENEKAVVANENSDPELVKKIVEERSGFVIEYAQNNGYDEFADKHAKQFFINPVLSSGRVVFGDVQNDYPEGGIGSGVVRKNVVASLLMRNSDLDTVKAVVETKWDGLPVDALYNKNITSDFVKSKADTVIFSSRQALFALESGNKGQFSDKQVEMLKGSSASYWTTGLTEGEKERGSDTKDLKLDRGFSFNQDIAKFHAQENEYNKLADKMSKIEDKTSKKYRKLEEVKGLADQWKDILKTRDALKQ